MAVGAPPPIASGGRAIYPAIAELADVPRWVCWKLEQRGGKPTKPPYRVGGRHMAKSTDPSTWDTFDACWTSAFAQGETTGIGIVLDGSDDLLAADLDHCVYESGEIMPWAKVVVRMLDSYTERSPSGMGLRIFFRGAMAEKGRKIKFRDGHLELYRSERYLTVTGAHLEQTPVTINHVPPEVVADLLERAEPPDRQPERNGHDPHPAAEISDELRDKLNEAIAEDTRLWEAWNGQAPAGSDQTRSAFDLRLAGAMRGNGAFTIDEFATLARHWQFGKGSEGDPRHWRRTWEKARRASTEARDAPPEPAPPFSYIENDDLSADVPKREFLVERWVPVGCVTSLYGSGGTGKSFLALMMAMCVAAGKKWLGFDCAQAPVLAVMCEDDEPELRRRRNKIARALGISAADVAHRLWIAPRVGEMNALMEFPNGVATRTPLFERIILEAREVQARMIILDNAAQLFGGNENDRAQVTAFLNACAGIANATSGAVLLLGHPPKTANVEFSGSTAWDAVVRSRMWFKRIDDEEEAVPGAPERYTLELVKSNYEKRFGIELHENPHGIVEYAGDLVKTKKTRETSADRVFSALRSLFETHRRAITQDEIVEECIRIGMYGESEAGSPARRKQQQRVREAMHAKRNDIDAREDGSYALKP